MKFLLQSNRINGLICSFLFVKPINGSGKWLRDDRERNTAVHL